MERAIFVTKPENLKYANDPYDRVYFGNEFCQRLIPSVEDLKAVKEFVFKNKMGFTLVTPYVTDEGIKNLRPVIEYALLNFSETEFVVNDWGVLKLITKEYGSSNINLGRLLTKQKRGPRILNLKDKVPFETMRHFQEDNVSTSLFAGFLTRQGVKRLEFDNLLQGMNRPCPVIKASLYFPFAYVTTSRFCPLSSCEKTRPVLRGMPDCGKECRKYVFRLRHGTMPAELLLKGNTQFFKNDSMPDNLKELNIDRIVYEPEIPI
jgi:hypothetical protein